MDDELEEIKALAKQALTLAEDTNHIVRGMRRSQRVGRFFSLVWWALIIAVSGATYYIYLQPYVTKIEDLYSQVQTGGQQVQGFQEQMQNFFKNFGSKPQ